MSRCQNHHLVMVMLFIVHETDHLCNNAFSGLIGTEQVCQGPLAIFDFFPSTHAIPAAATQPGLHRQRRAHTSTNQQRGRMGWPGLYGQVYRKLAATCKARVQYRFHINHSPSLLCPKGGSILICRNLSTHPHVAHQWDLKCHDWAGFRAFAWAEAATGINVVALNWLQQLLLY